MSIEQEVELIRQFPIFQKIQPAMQKLLCFGSERLTYDPGQIVVREGDAADAVYVLIEGAVEITISSPKGPIVVNTIGRHEVIGEIAIFGDVPRTATVTAIARVDALKISKGLFINIVRQSPDAAIELLRILSTRLANTTRQLTRTAAASK
ncbi:MAG: cyclic nucleotide-binding domain-containing protein [Betaproteobacteria bacterium]|nr:cyclic nucleotide-binding domain-containing protein [Betaproteobacteria bacterium]